MTKLSIVIPTHDRPIDTLENVAALVKQVSGRPIEIIVVDSASSPASAEQLRALRLYPQTRLYRTDRPGSSLSRNAGVKASSGEWLSFLDDDVIVHPRWADNVLKRIGQCSNDIGFVGGRAAPKWPPCGYDIPPHGLGPRARTLLSILDCELSFDSTSNAIGIGANMLVPRHIFDLVGGFSEKIGRVGQGLGSGEEIQLMDAIVRAGYRAWYDGLISVDHKISSHRMNSGWLARRAQHEGAVSYRRLMNTNDKAALLCKCIATLPTLGLLGRSYEPIKEYLIRLHHNIGVIRSSIATPL